MTAPYVAGHTAGRGWIEALRDDHANHIAGLRLNDWTCIFVFIAAITVLFRLLRGAAPEVEPAPERVRNRQDIVVEIEEPSPDRERDPDRDAE